MEHLLSLRSRYGSVFATELPDGRVIPWRPLTIGEFMEYDVILKTGQYPLAAIEDEVFRKCVLDEGAIHGMDDRKAGIVSTIATAIFAASGPSSTEEMNQIMYFNRMQAAGVFPYIVSVICQAFPAYKPEEVYAMDYSTMMERLAQAEHKLLRTGMINEPISFISASDQQQQQQPARRQRVDSSELFEKYYDKQGPNPAPPPTPQIPPPPPPKKPGNKTVITETDIAEHTTHYTGHEAEDRIILEANMVDETAQIYGDYIEQLQKDGKVVIPSHEERMAAAKKRAEENRQKAIEVARAKKAEELEMQKAIAKAQAKKRAAKKKK